MSALCYLLSRVELMVEAPPVPSYLQSREELMVKAPPVPSSLTDTFLVSGGAALVFLLLSVELSGTSPTGA